MAFQLRIASFAAFSAFLTLGHVAAHTAIAQSIQDQPNTNIAVSVAQLRIPEKAIEHLLKARNAAVHQKLDEFHKELALALAIAPKYSEAYVLKATVDVHQHQYDAALEDANTALALDPLVPWGIIIRASACNGLHRYAEARTLLEHYNPIQGPRWAVLFEQTRAAIGLRDTEKALSLSAETLSIVPENWSDNAHLLRANAFQINHSVQSAIHEYELYLSSPRPQPLRTVVLDMLQRSQQSLNQSEVATLTTR